MESNRIKEEMDRLYSFPEDVPDEMKMKIGGLRQWLNEVPDRRLVTNEDIWHWLK